MAKNERGRYVGQLTQEAAQRLNLLGKSLTVLVWQQPGPEGLFVVASERGSQWEQVTPSDFQGEVLMPVRSILRTLANEP